MVVVTILGTRGEVEEHSKKHSKHSGILLEEGSTRVLVDLGEKEYLDLKPDAIILTHYHPDHFSKEIERVEAPLYTFRSIYKLIKTEVANFRPIEPETPFKIGNLTFTAYPTMHSIKTDSFAVKVKNKGTILITSDHIWIEDSEEAMKSVDLYIGEASAIEKGIVRKRDTDLGGHCSVKDQIGRAVKAGIPLVVFTHLGAEAIKMGDRELEDKINELLRARQERGEVTKPIKILIAYDGMTIDTAGLISTEDIEAILPKVIMKPVAGLILVAPHGQLIWEGKKTAIVKSRKYEKYIQLPLLLIQDKKAWAIITLDKPKEIDWKEFKELEPSHKISMDEAKAWGWTKYDKLWYYPVKIIRKFDEPIPVDYPQGAQVFVDIDKITLKE